MVYDLFNEHDLKLFYVDSFAILSLCSPHSADNYSANPLFWVLKVSFYTLNSLIHL